MSIEDRLRRLEDLESIRQLFVDYGHHLDRGDVASYADLFAPDGEVLLGPLGRATGRAEITELMTRVLDDVTGSSFHLIANPIVHLHGDTADAEVTWAVVAREVDGSPDLTMLGRHVDRLVRLPEGWRFQRRAGHVDIPSLYPGARTGGTN